MTAVGVSLAKLVAAGADYRRAYLTFQEFFEKLRDEPERWGKPFAALLGALRAQLDFGRAAIGGKDSMSGTFNDLDVPPTLISFAIAPIRAGEVLSPEFKGAGHPVYAFGGSCGAEDLKAAWEAFHDLCRAGEGPGRLGGGERRCGGRDEDVLRQPHRLCGDPRRAPPGSDPAPA